MKLIRIYIFTFSLLFELFFFLNSNIYCQNKKGEIFRGIVSSSLFQNMKSQDVEAATKMLASELNKESDLNIKYKIEICNKLNEIKEKTKEPFVILYVSPIEFLQVRKDRNLDPIYISEINKSFGDIYHLITNKRGNKKTLKDFKNGIINILANSENQVPTLWLDKLLMLNKLPLSGKFFKKVTIDNKSNNIVLPVFFNKIDATIVTKASFDRLCELNPKIREEIEIVEKSKPMIKAIFCSDVRNKIKIF